jgi:hypothetical protein
MASFAAAQGGVGDAGLLEGCGSSGAGDTLCGAIVARVCGARRQKNGTLSLQVLQKPGLQVSAAL